jgi:hypothetical protein
MLDDVWRSACCPATTPHLMPEDPQQSTLLRPQINEFHNAPTPFFFTSPLNSTVLPTLRVSGEGVLKEFGFQAHRFWGDVLAVIACSEPPVLWQTTHDACWHGLPNHRSSAAAVVLLDLL